MHYTIQGHGPPLLFIHGWAMHGGVWADLAQEFSACFQTITVDLRGHGASRSEPGPYGYDNFARDILDLLNALSLHAVAGVGWSMGASILLRACGLSPEKFKRLIFISGNPSLVTRPDYTCGIPEITVQRLARQVGRSYPAGLKNFYNLLLTQKERELFSKDPQYEKITDTALAPEKSAALATLASLMQEDLRPELACIAAPALIVHGDEDAICNPQAAAFMHAAIPGSQLAIIRQTGHIPFLTRRRETADRLRAFLESPA